MTAWTGLGLSAVASLLYLTWSPIVFGLRLRSVSGTHRRYVMNTIERVMCPLSTPIIVVVLTFVPAATSHWFTVTAIISCALTAHFWYKTYRIVRADDRDDDDDWFTKTMGRIKKWARTRGLRRLGVLHG